jgi:hypothetical protein
MSIVELVPVSDDEQDLEIVLACKDGVLVPQAAKQFGLSQHEVNTALDRALPKIDEAYKRRAIALSSLRLDELTEVFHKQAKGGDIEAGNLRVRFKAERRALLGLTGSNYAVRRYHRSGGTSHLPGRHVTTWRKPQLDCPICDGWRGLRDTKISP